MNLTADFADFADTKRRIHGPDRNYLSRGIQMSSGTKAQGIVFYKEEAEVTEELISVFGGGAAFDD